MDETMRLILECLKTLLLCERKRSEAELREHRHPLVKQEHELLIAVADHKIEQIDNRLNPPEEVTETDETGDRREDQDVPGADSE